MTDPKRTIPEISRIQSFRDSGRMRDNPCKVFDEYRKELGSTYAFYFGGVMRSMVTSDAELIQYILKDHYENYQKSEIEMKRMVHFLGKGLLTTHGKYWLTQRRLIQQGFHKKRLSAMMAGMQEMTNASLDKLINEDDKSGINVHEFMNRLTLKMVMQSLFSTRLKDEELEFISDTISRVQGFLVKQIVQPYLNPWFRISGTLKKYEQLRYESDDIIFRYIKSRKSEGVHYDDLLQILMDARYADTGDGMTEPQILAESIQLMVAGHETTSTALSWILYLLTQHPESLEKIREEITRIAGDESIGFSDIPAFEYTSRVIDEALRLYPPFWMVDRMAMKDDEYSGIRIPKGSTIIAFIYGVHHSDEYWEEPQRFNPDRFLKENSKKRPAFSHIPFGGGPKGCIGGNYAMMQMLVILTTLLRKFDFSLTREMNITPRPMLILRPGNGIGMKFTERGMTSATTRFERVSM